MTAVTIRQPCVADCGRKFWEGTGVLAECAMQNSVRENSQILRKNSVALQRPGCAGAHGKLCTLRRMFSACAEKGQVCRQGCIGTARFRFKPNMAREDLRGALSVRLNLIAFAKY